MSPLVAVVIVIAIVAALLFVAFGRRDAPRARADRSWTRKTTRDRDVVSEATRLRTALDEIAFDRSSGKLAEADYLALRKKYDEALTRGAVSPSPPSKVWDDAELLVARARAEQSACPSCGPRPEHAPAYCSNCGLHLLACRACGVRPGEIGARFCSQCGSRLAA